MSCFHVFRTARDFVRSMPLVIAIVLVGGVSHAQDDPFSSNDPFGSSDPSSEPVESQDQASSDSFALGADSTSSAPASQASSTPSEIADPIQRDPLVLILRDNPPETPRDFGRAVMWMTQLGYWSEAASLLDQIAAKGWGLQHQVELARAAGPQVWIRLRKHDVPLNEAQRKLAGEIFNAPASLARDPNIINDRINKLTSPDAVTRRQAQLQLQDAGSVAIGRLLDRLLDGDNAVPADMLAGTIVEFGSEGIEALQAACAMSDLARSSRAILAVTDLPSNHFPSEIASSLHSLRFPIDLKQAVAELLAKRGRNVPSELATSEYVRRRFNDALASYQGQRSAADSLTSLLWRPNSEGDQIVQQEATSQSRSLERLSQIALQQATLNTASPSDQAAAGAALLQRSYHLDPDFAFPDLDLVLTHRFSDGDSDQTGFWMSIFEQAGKWEMHGACVRSLAHLATQVVAGRAIPPMDFLSKLLADPRPIIRYHAFGIIAAIDPKSDYVGSQQAFSTAIEMLELGQGPRSLIVGADLDLCMVAEAGIRQTTGGDAIAVTSGRDALRELSSANPIELIFVIDRVHDMNLFELLQRLRNTQNGGSLPIAVLTEQLYPYEQKLVDSTPGVVVSVLSRQPESMTDTVSKLLGSFDTLPLSGQDRSRFAQVAETFVKTVAGDRQTYSFYPLDDWQQPLAHLPASASRAAQMQVLAGAASSASQLRLIQLVAAPGVSETDRDDAARAFEASVQKFGMLLSQQDVQSAYDLYNRLGPNDPTIARTMGFVLDVIEDRAR